MKALVVTAVVLVTLLAVACGSSEQATQPRDESLLRVLVTPWGLYVEQHPEPLTLAQLDARLRTLEGHRGAVRIERATTFAGQTAEPTAATRAKVERLAQQVAQLAGRHDLPSVVEAGVMPVRGWASPLPEGER